MYDWGESDIEEEKAGASNANITIEAKRAKLAVTEAYPLLIHGIPLKPAAHATIDAPDETETKLLSESRPSHLSAEGVHFGDGTLDESRISLLKKLLTDSMLFEPSPHIRSRAHLKLLSKPLGGHLTVDRIVLLLLIVLLFASLLTS